MMSVIEIIQNIPPAFYGIMVGSMLTLIGVTLTNSSNTKRLRIQHEHERNLENKTRDINLRKEVLMGAMEAISAGLIAVSRFSELSISTDELLRSYTDLSPKIWKVIIVGKSETIKGVATFNQEMTGAFLRLTAKREKNNTLLEKSSFLKKELEAAQKDLNSLSAAIKENADKKEGKTQTDQLKKHYDVAQKQVESLHTEYTTLDNQIIQMKLNLVKESLAEVEKLDLSLVPLIGLMRAELELPFNEAFFSNIFRKTSEKQSEYFESYFREYQQKIHNTEA